MNFCKDLYKYIYSLCLSGLGVRLSKHSLWSRNNSIILTLQEDTLVERQDHDGTNGAPAADGDGTDRASAAIEVESSPEKIKAERVKSKFGRLYN